MEKLAKGLTLGGLSGVLSGWLILFINMLTGVFVLEMSFGENLLTFGIGGGLFGLVCGGLMAVVHEKLPIKSFPVKAVVIFGFVWVLFRLAGIVLSGLEPHRFHGDIGQSLQGFAFAIILGGMFGLFWVRGKKIV